MPNPNPPKDPNIAAKGAATRFGEPGGPDPVSTGKKGGDAIATAFSIRRELKYIAAQEIDMDHFDAEIKALMRVNKTKASFARIAAVRMFEKMIKRMDAPIANAVIENIEGKLTQELIIPSMQPAPTTFATLEEASQAYKDYMGK